MIEVSSGSKGIDWLLLGLKWSKSGLIAELQVDPRVEDFFSQLTAGQYTALSNYGGKDWIPVGDGDSLQSYSVSQETFHDTNNFYLGLPGWGFSSGQYPNKVNLSLLHLVGASKGLKFVIKTPVSGMAKMDLRVRMEKGMQEFVRQYLTFGKMALRVFSAEE